MSEAREGWVLGKYANLDFKGEGKQRVGRQARGELEEQGRKQECKGVVLDARERRGMGK